MFFQLLYMLGIEPGQWRGPRDGRHQPVRAVRQGAGRAGEERPLAAILQVSSLCSRVAKALGRPDQYPGFLQNRNLSTFYVIELFLEMVCKIFLAKERL